MLCEALYSEHYELEKAKSFQPLGRQLPSDGASALGSASASTTESGLMRTACTRVHVTKASGSNAMTFCHMHIESCALFMELKSRSRARAVNRTSLGGRVKFSVNIEATTCGACNKVTNGTGHFTSPGLKLFYLRRPS